MNFDFKKRSLITMGALLVVFTLFFASHTGNKVLVGIINYLMPQINIELHDGKLLSGGKLSLSFRSPSVNVSATHARLNLTWFDCATICLSLQVDKLMVTATGPAAAPQEASVHSDTLDEGRREPIDLPISLAIASLHVNTFVLNSDDHLIELSDINMSGQADDSLIHIAHLQSEVFRIKQLRLSSEPSRNVPDSLAPIVAPDLYIPIDIELPKLQISQIEYHPVGQAPIAIDNFELALSVKSQTVRVHSLVFNYLQHSAYAALDYDFKAHSIHGSVGIAHPTGALSAVVQGNFEKLNIKSRASGQQQAKALLSVSPAIKNWPFTLDTQVSRVDIGQTARLSQFKLKGQGSANDYAFSMQGIADLSHLYEQTLSAHIQASVSGTLSSLEIKNSRIQVEKAYTDLSAKVDWQQGINLAIEGALAHLPIPNMGLGDHQHLSNGLLGSLSGTYAMQFEQADSTWHANIEQFQLHGEVAKQPLSLTIRGDVNEQLQGHLARAQLQYGASAIDLSGTLGKELDLTAKLAINQHSTPLLPVDLTLHGGLEITGPASAPKVVANSMVSRFVYDELTLKDAQLTSDIDFAKDFAGNISMAIAEANLPGIENGKVAFNARGSLINHTVDLKLESQRASADMAISGQYKNTHWDGQINESRFAMASLSLMLNDPIKLTVSDTALSISEHCWQVSSGQACLSANQQDALGEAKVNLTDIPIDIASAWFPDGVSAEGKLTGQSELQWDHNRLSALAGNLGLINGKVELSKAQANVEELPDALPTALTIESFDVELNGDANKAHVDWQVQLAKLGSFNGSLLFPDISNTKAVNGYIDVNAIQLKEFTPYLRVFAWPDLTVAGQLDGRVELQGNIEQPKVMGRFKADGVSVLSSYLPMQITDLELDIGVQDESVKLQGKVQTPESGVANLYGTATLQPDLAIDLNINGQHLFMTPMAGVQVAVSPDLQIQFAQQQLNVMGEINVPFARFTLSTLPEGAIVVSEDQVLLGAEEQASQSPLMDFQADIDINLLDDVRVVALGLDAYLNGELSLEKQLGTAILAAGEVSLREGKYTAFGQDLFIKTGQLGFNGPLDKPYLNIRAIRNPDTTANGVIAGVAVQGSIAAPELTIFSEPAMDQAKALAYLLNGEALGAGESSNNTMLAQFLLSKSIDKSKGLFTKAGKKLGLKDVNLAAKGSGDDTQVELSGYITPSVQVSYRVGVFASLSEIAVRYRIFSKLYIEATSGLYDSIDLLYKFDWGG
ncbi:translocation/assembly module TamB domain-containing protein [Pseudoalteromonas luteoviolacea]|uniref:translocation/assembly module TamB domain-containing protein n=1 Tax=Pseudoalteromonas luteoviolacea TaxID=43657 RepID=UPI000A839A7A|nr:translocation/assembly module TamB domain-containing protein [Pseudoalteromonas luteoviolacea]